MKKGLIVLMVVALPLPLAAFPLGWLTVSAPCVTQLDSDSYRLRFDVDWGGDNYVDPVYDVVDVPPVFSRLTCSVLGTTQYNATANCGDLFTGYNTPGDWYGGGTVGLGAFCLGSGEFGYDFDYMGPIGVPIIFSYSASIVWNGLAVTQEYDEGWICYDETFSGETLASAVPEPTTLTLFGLGLIGAAMIRRRKPQ